MAASITHLPFGRTHRHKDKRRRMICCPIRHDRNQKESNWGSAMQSESLSSEECSLRSPSGNLACIRIAKIGGRDAACHRLARVSNKTTADTDSSTYHDRLHRSWFPLEGLLSTNPLKGVKPTSAGRFWGGALQ